MSGELNRREMLRASGGILAGVCLHDRLMAAMTPDAVISPRGAVVAALAPTSARTGHDILTGGGNAIDAAVAVSFA